MSTVSSDMPRVEVQHAPLTLQESIEVEGLIWSELVAAWTAKGATSSIQLSEAIDKLNTLVEAHAVCDLEPYGLLSTQTLAHSVLREDRAVLVNRLAGQDQESRLTDVARLAQAWRAFVSQGGALPSFTALDAAIDQSWFQVPTHDGFRPGIVLGHRAVRRGLPTEGRNCESAQVETSGNHSSRKYAALPENLQQLTGPEFAALVESSFERLHLSLNFLCLELVRSTTTDDEDAQSRWTQRWGKAKEDRDRLLSLVDYDTDQVRKMYWQGELPRGATPKDHGRLGLPDTERRHQLYLDHDGFRLGKLMKEQKSFAFLSDALLDLSLSCFKGTNPEHKYAAEVYGIGPDGIDATQPETRWMIEVLMEDISGKMVKSMQHLKQEALRSRNSFLVEPFPPPASTKMPYVTPEGRLVPEIELRIYRGEVPENIIARCVSLANATVDKDVRSPRLALGGLTEEVDFDEISSMCRRYEPHLSAVAINGEIQAYELVFADRSVLDHPDYDEYFEQHPFHRKKTVFLKHAMASKQSIRSLRKLEVSESPFDMVHRRMLSELNPTSIDYLLCQIRQAPVKNQASMNAALRSYGLPSGIKISDSKDGVCVERELVLLPLRFQGFFNTHMDYPKQT